MTSKTEIGDLPIDCLEHVFNFCDLKQVFRCMSVSREWNRAARSAVFRRKCLCLRDEDLRDEEKSLLTLDHIRYTTINEKGMMEQMLKSLSVMQCLTKLYVASLPEDMHRRFMESIILNNSSTLKDADVFKLPVKNGVVYPQLTILDCMHWRHEVVSFCPRLEELGVHLDEVVTLGLLSSEKMKRLELTFYPRLIIGGTFALVVELQRFQHLRKLHIIAKLDPDFHDGEWQPPAHHLLKLFSTYTKLEDLHVESEVPIWANMDSHVDVLVNKNPRLLYVYIHIHGATMTDATLLTLARLTHLHCLYLHPELTADFTTAGILSLLRGHSRSKLRRVHIDHTHPVDMTVITAELMSTSEETGRVVLKVEDELTRRPVGTMLNLELSSPHCCAH